MIRVANNLTRTIEPVRSSDVDEVRRAIASFSQVSNSVKDLAVILPADVAPMINVAASASEFLTLMCSQFLSNPGDQVEPTQLLSQIERAEASCQQVFSPEHPLFMGFKYTRASIQRKQGDSAGAMAEYEEILHRFDSSGLGTESPLRRNVLLNHGQVAEKLGNDEKALDSYMKVIAATDPDPVRHAHYLFVAYVLVAQLFMKRGELDVALQFFTNIVDAPNFSPQSIEIQFGLRGMFQIYEQRGQWAQPLVVCCD
ncbi:unnamed protein product [Didymodactylos carnosus]|uniref:Tetratricopeptide repeat protein n=1 Tax=Didymodactylos carnosus TaxID=1234261 RepID=A0A815I8G8_9BILA|nr:unnamed protein product [Didymodactylos carnosus]CAF4246647.1 unnamed protein product [Didymodactylos carnosus]